MLMDRASGQSRELVPTWDRSAESYQFTDGGRAIVIVTGDRGRDRIFRLPLTADGRASSAMPLVMVGTMHNVAPTISRDGRWRDPSA